MTIVADRRSVAVVAAGFAAGLVAAGWGATLGGGLMLSRLDPLFSLPGRIIVAALLAYALGTRPCGQRGLALAAMLIVAFGFDVAMGRALAGAVAWGQAGVALGLQLLAWLVGGVAARSGRLRRGPVAKTVAVAMLGAIGLSAPWAAARFYAPWDAPDRTRLTVLAGVPIEWRGAADMTAILRGTAQPSPVLPALAERFAIVRLDRIDADALGRADILLLAHPPALPPEALVELDDWIRRGGRAVILADPLVSWPADFPIGDRRNPPVTSLLTPLLNHWGLTLTPPPDPSRDDIVMDGRHRVRLVSAGRLTVAGDACRTRLDGRIAVCRLGRGRVAVVADADFVNPTLWEGRKPGPAYWREGNMGWILALLGDFDDRPAASGFRPAWIRPGGGGESRADGTK